MWQIADEKKSGIAKGTPSVTWRYTTSTVTKIYRAESEVFGLFYRVKNQVCFWLQSLLPISGITGRLCALAGASDLGLSWGRRQWRQSPSILVRSFKLRTSGFSFVARQQRISAEDEHFYIDLVFYNYILKCFVLVDLKVGKLTHQDIGQMDLYVRYYEDQVKQTSDNPTIGLILCTEKKETIVKYSVSLPNINYTCQPKKSW